MRLFRSPRLDFWLTCLILFVIVESLDRFAVLAWECWVGAGFAPDLLWSIPIGMADDLLTGIVLGAPFLTGLYLFAPLFRRRWARIGAHALLLGMLGLLIFIETSEVLFWNEFDSRFNGIAVNYLIFPREVIGNLRESFNLALLLPLVGLAAGGLYLCLRRPLDAALGAPMRRRTIMARAALTASTAGALALAGVYALPADALSARAANEAAKNGIHSLVHAALTNDERYDGLYQEVPEAEARALARQTVAQDNTRFIGADGADADLTRRVENPGPAKRLNVVLVIEESFGSVYVDGLDNHRGESISPNLTRIAQDGVLFTNIYATGNRTVRGLEALLTSFPPIPGISTSRRAGSRGMHSLPALLGRNGYDTAFLYGGRALFDNMGPYWSGIGFGQVWDQSDIAEAGFTTAWGVADEYLFGEALKRMDAMTQAGKPVFLGLLTVSNHRPYVYPDGRIEKPAKKKRRENSATYADWAFGDFIARAKTKPWFDDTVFVFIGDHGPRVYGAAQVPVPSYRVPLLFYAPAHLKPARIDTLGSSMDMAPTLLGLMNWSYESPFFGLDLRRVPAGGGRIAMEHNYSVAFGDGREVAMLLPGRAARGYAMQVGPHELTPEPDANADLLRRAAGLFQTAHHLFYQSRYHTPAKEVAARN